VQFKPAFQNIKKHSMIPSDPAIDFALRIASFDIVVNRDDLQKARASAPGAAAWSSFDSATTGNVPEIMDADVCKSGRI
jgi:hypothetical protein